MKEIIHLKKQLHEISFYEREKVNGKTVRNKCGRDFLYYVFNYHLSEEFNVARNNPLDIDRAHLFGYPVPALLAWSQIQFLSLASFLKSYGLSLKINHRPSTNFLSFVAGILFSRMTYQEGIRVIEDAIQSDETVGIDISLGWGGLLDHVMFVYGYDEDNLYVIDTHQVPTLEYESVEASQYYFKLPKSVIRTRWTRWGRVWRVVQK